MEFQAGRKQKSEAEAEVNSNEVVNESPEFDFADDLSNSDSLKETLTQLAFTPTFARMKLQVTQSTNTEEAFNTSADTIILLDEDEDPSPQNSGDVKPLIVGGSDNTLILSQDTPPPPPRDKKSQELEWSFAKEVEINNPRANHWVRQMLSASMKKLTLNDATRPLESFEEMRSPSRTMEDLREGMKLSSEIMKKGVKHHSKDSKAKSKKFLPVKIKQKSQAKTLIPSQRRNRSQFLEKLLKEEAGDNGDDEDFSPSTSKQSVRKKRRRSSSSEVLPPTPSSSPVSRTTKRPRRGAKKKPVVKKSQPEPWPLEDSPGPRSSPLVTARKTDSEAPGTCPICFRHMKISVLERHAGENIFECQYDCNSHHL